MVKIKQGDFHEFTLRNNDALLSCDVNNNIRNYG